jgi:hypothetical protein
MGVKGHPCVQLFSQESTSWKRTSDGDDVIRSLHEMVLKLNTLKGHLSYKWTLFVKCSFKGKIVLCTVSLLSLHQTIKGNVNFNYYPVQRCTFRRHLPESIE